MNRFREKLSYGYKFRLYQEGTADEAVYTPGYDDSDWETIRVPHDWAADGEFCIDNDAIYETAPDGTTAYERCGWTGGLPTVGLGVYRRWIDIDAADEGKSISIEFDGVMWESHIYVNGKHIHFNHFGYKSFSVDITDALEYGKPNLIAVAAYVYHDCSRWYSGAGIYRNVYLVKKSAQHINYNGVWLRQLEVACGHADFLLSLDYTGSESLKFKADIFDPAGSKIAEVEHGTYFGELSDIFTIPDIKLWDVDSPNLYTAAISLLDEDGNVLDTESVRFGARNFEFTLEHGFFLNGRNMKLNGVCIHHDVGSLGAVVNVAAIRRQLRLLREMGANAIRTTHNPPSPELLDLCDEMGFIVMDEFFDEWYMPKISNGYSKYYREHAEKDAADIILRDRNHPSIMLWSIGNELFEQHTTEGWREAKFLTELCHRIDPTRPVTAGYSNVCAFDNHLSEFVDILGMNYKPDLYGEFRRDHPNMKLLGTETASCISIRGVYKLPAKIAIPCNKHDDLTVSAYELEAPNGDYYPEREFAMQDDHPYVAGEFVWTGIDYLGEPTPYKSEWPARSSYFGAIDLAGIPKNRFYGYRAHWSKLPTLHIFPHWNWEGMEGQIVPVHIYTNYDSVELFVNGKSCGIRTHAGKSESEDLMEREVARYRLMWNNVVYEPGEVKAIARDENGCTIAEAVVRTAGNPAAITLCADRPTISADGDDLVYVTASIVDEKGVLCPLADNRLFFSVTGDGELLTTDNGDPRETEAFVRHDKKVLAGKAVACIRSIKDQPGRLKLTVSAEGLAASEIEVNVQPCK